MPTAGPSTANTSLSASKPKNCSTTPRSFTRATASSTLRSPKLLLDAVSTRYTSWPRFVLTTSPSEYAPLTSPLESYTMMKYPDGSVPFGSTTSTKFDVAPPA